MAPMVHWPEVMVTYEKTDKIVFSADGFGKFGTLDTDEDWTCEARRYYFNIVRKIWNASAKFAEKIGKFRRQYDLSITWANFEGKFRILYGKI